MCLSKARVLHFMIPFDGVSHFVNILYYYFTQIPVLPLTMVFWQLNILVIEINNCATVIHAHSHLFTRLGLETPRVHGAPSRSSLLYKVNVVMGNSVE